MNRSTFNYLLQRITAVLLLPLSLWLILIVIPQIMTGLLLNQGKEIDLFFSSIYNVILLLLYIEIGFYHGFLGISSILKDYVTCNLSRKMMMLLLIAISLFCGVAGFMLILDQHILTLSR